MSNKKDKLIALVAAIVFHALLLLLLAFLTIHKAKIDKEREDGVPVLLGQVEDAAGEDMGGLPVDAGEAEEDVDGAGEHEPEVESVPVAPAHHKSQPKIEGISLPSVRMWRNLKKNRMLNQSSRKIKKNL